MARLLYFSGVWTAFLMQNSNIEPFGYFSHFDYISFLKSFSFLRYVVLKTMCDSFVYYNCVFWADPPGICNSVFCTITELSSQTAIIAYLYGRQIDHTGAGLK